MENLLIDIRDKLDDNIKHEIYKYYVSIKCFEKRELNQHIQLYHSIKQNPFQYAMRQNIEFDNLSHINQNEPHEIYYDSDDSSTIGYEIHDEEF